VAWLLLGYSSPKLRPTNVFFTPKPLSVPRPPFRLSCEKRLLAKNVTKRMKKRCFLLFDFFIDKAFILFNKTIDFFFVY
jgi:hypothetical protein